ncbi:MAG: hypothetical protein ACI4AL_04730 [Aristaeellaceae bacterium]
MKKTLKILVAMILTLSLLAGTALACDGMGYNVVYLQNCGTVYASEGSSYIRTAPCLEGFAIDCLDQGTCAIYCGYSEFDWRGVRWDYIYYNGTVGWVSSRYTTLYC